MRSNSSKLAKAAIHAASKVPAKNTASKVPANSSLARELSTSRDIISKISGANTKKIDSNLLTSILANGIVKNFAAEPEKLVNAIEDPHDSSLSQWQRKFLEQSYNSRVQKSDHSNYGTISKRNFGQDILGDIEQLTSEPSKNQPLSR